MRIGELAGQVGVGPDTIRDYEREGLLPRPPRAGNGYREYGAEDVDHLRLVTDLRRLDLPLSAAARLATWCHSGHCDRTSVELPRDLAERRREIADRIAGLLELDARLARLEHHPSARPRARADLTVIDSGACCSAAAAVGADATCACCAD